jgi:hypothetical protein
VNDICDKEDTGLEDDVTAHTPFEQVTTRNVQMRRRHQGIDLHIRVEHYGGVGMYLLERAAHCGRSSISTFAGVITGRRAWPPGQEW